MTPKEAKAYIDKSGEAYLTFSNDDEYCFVGQVDKMTTKDDRVKLVWKLPKTEHVSAFDHATISGAKTVYSREEIAPIRLDNGTKKYEVSWDV